VQARAETTLLLGEHRPRAIPAGQERLVGVGRDLDVVDEHDTARDVRPSVHARDFVDARV
jgi:hypothetical protein